MYWLFEKEALFFSIIQRKKQRFFCTTNIIITYICFVFKKKHIYTNQSKKMKNLILFAVVLMGIAFSSCGSKNAEVAATEEPVVIEAVAEEAVVVDTLASDSTVANTIVASEVVVAE
ncbi:MAG: hypothetical protein ACRCSQ_03865 [Bacteroidales bacterium]